MTVNSICKNIKNIGASDRELRRFEGQYPLANGMAYNSYVICDEKTALLDCTDEDVKSEFLSNLEDALGGKRLDYIIIQHLEPDHSGSLEGVLEKYPEAQLVLSAAAKRMLPLFASGTESRAVTTVADGGSLSLGKRTLKFFTAPMVHWPDVIVTYDETDEILFSADAFGKFGGLDAEEPWEDEARRYYFNIVGKYGAQVQALLKKLGGLSVKTICPLHGPVLAENLGHYLGLYDIWSRYEPEEDGVFIAAASLHGNTIKAAETLKEKLLAAGAKKVSLFDLSEKDVSDCVAEAFRYKKTVFAASSYDAGVMPKMEDFLSHLKSKNFQNRTAALIENTSWAPSAARTMKAALEQMKNIEILEPVVTVKVKMTSENENQLDTLVKELIK